MPVRLPPSQHPPTEGVTSAQARPKRATLVAMAGVAVALGAGPFLSGLLRTLDPPELELHPSPRELPPLRFAGPNGVPTSLAARRGGVVLLNFWATWCPPCVKEMPSLDRLQAALGGSRFEVVAVSIDVAGAAAIQAFFQRTGILHLRQYFDAFDEASLGWTATGIPLSVLVDPQGREIARHRGASEWDQTETMELLRRQL
jgi:thiol-disulfide isomerase/thioredoxin